MDKKRKEQLRVGLATAIGGGEAGYIADQYNKGQAEDIPIIGGIFASGKRDRAAADAALRDLERQYQGLELPNLTDVSYENQSWLQDLSPEQMDAVLQGSSAFEGISTDPRLHQEQMASLNALSDLAKNGGLNASDKAALAKIQSDTATADKGRRDAILQNMQQRGMSGSGLEMLNQLQSNQAATDRQSQAGLDIAGMAQDRALQAMMQSGQLAGRMRDQSFGEQAQIARARDAINQFNTGNINQARQFNTGLRQDTAMYNNQGRQATANANVDTRNQATWQNHQNPQQDFQNRLSKVDGLAGVNRNKVDLYQRRADQKEEIKRDAWGNIVKGGVAAYTGGG